MKTLVGSLGMPGLMVKHMERRKHNAAMFTDRSFQDSPRQYNSHTIMAWPNKNKRASRALRRNALGTVREVDKQRTQARSSRRAFIWNKVKVENGLITETQVISFFTLIITLVHHYLTRIALQAGWV